MILVLCCLAFLLYRCATLWPTRHKRNRAWWIGLTSAVMALGGMVIGLVSDVVAQKALGLLLMPAGFAWVLLLVVTVLVWRSGPRRLAWLTTSATLLYTLAGNAWLGDALMMSLESRIPPHDLGRTASFDAVCVLGGGTEYSAADGPSLSSGGDRLALAARLWHAGKTKIIVVSGSSIAAMELKRDLAAESAALLTGLGVDPRAIIQVGSDAVVTTHEINAYATLIRTNGWTRVGLVSSAWHLPRALRLCDKAGLTLVPLGADRRGRFRGWSPYWLIPQDHGFDRVQRACWEYLGMLIGR